MTEYASTIEFLTLQYRRVNETYALIAPRRAEREELQKYVARVQAALAIRGPDPNEFLNDLTVQQQLAAAVAAETQAVASYNIALAQFEYAKGTIQQYNHVSVGEGPLPPWVSKRAADHIRERTEAAIKLREAPLPAGGSAVGGHPVAQAGGTNSLLQLPPFAEKRDPLPMELPKGSEPTNPPPAKPKGSDALPGALGAQPQPFPTLGPAGAPDTFQPTGRATLPSGTRPIGTRPPAAGTGATNSPDEHFRSEGRALVPEPPPYRSAVPPATTGAPPTLGPLSEAGESFGPTGRATLPPEPKTSVPAWNQPGRLEPPAIGAALPQPPAIPPTLPPIPGGQ